MTHYQSRAIRTLTAVIVIVCPAIARGQTTQPFDSLLDLQQHFAKRIKQTRREIEADRLLALRQLLEKATGYDRQDVMIAMLHSATFLKRSEEVVALSDSFFQEHPDSPAAWAVRAARYEAMIDLDRVADARKEWEAASAQVDRAQWQRIFEIGMRIAEAYLDRGQIDQVRTLYETLRKRFNFVRDVGEVLGAKTDELYWIGRPAPSLEGKDLDGKLIDLTEQYKGKVVLIDYWATWCAPCLAAMPKLIDTYKRYRDSGFEIIGVNLDNDADALKKYLSRSGITWRQVSDGQSYRSPNLRKYDVMAIPAAFLIDRQGKIARVGVPVDGFGPVIERLLAEQDSPKQ
jgi:thiol-disulfide isomerase/thioredoxin